MDPGWWLHRFFECQQTAEQNMARYEHRDVRRGIVGAVMMPLGPTMAALVLDRQEASKQVGLTARRTTFGKADPHRPPPIAVTIRVLMASGRGRTIVEI